MTSRDPKSGRFARRPVPDFDAESRFDSMGDSIEDITNVSGAPSPSTIDYRRHAPSGDELAQGGQRSPLRARNATLVHPDDEGNHNAVMRSAIRRLGPVMDNPMPYLAGLTSHGTPASGVRQVSDDVPDVPADVRGDLRPVARGLGRGRDRR